MFKLDRTAFSKDKADTMSNNVQYWLEKTPQERLAGAWYLICSAYGIDYKTSSSLPLDRSVFSCGKMS